MKVQGLSLQEASVATGKSVASLKVSVHRALKAMRDMLKRES
jgi:DNA-directed RNA polymerase specialized sigma24 family protein